MIKRKEFQKPVMTEQDKESQNKIASEILDEILAEEK